MKHLRLNRPIRWARNPLPPFPPIALVCTWSEKTIHQDLWGLGTFLFRCGHGDSCNYGLLRGKRLLRSMLLRGNWCKLLMFYSLRRLYGVVQNVIPQKKSRWWKYRFEFPLGPGSPPFFHFWSNLPFPSQKWKRGGPRELKETRTDVSIWWAQS